MHPSHLPELRVRRLIFVRISGNVGRVAQYTIDVDVGDRG